MYFRIIFAVFLCLISLPLALGQSGGSYEITQSLIANGGGTSADAGYSLTGSVAQPVAGATSTGGSYSVTGGFWQFALAPTAAMVSVSGQVLTAHGSGISKAQVIITDAAGTSRQVLTNPFGNFYFADVEVGQTYVVSVSSKQYEFVEGTRVISVVDEITGLNFVALPD